MQKTRFKFAVLADVMIGQRLVVQYFPGYIRSRHLPKEFLRNLGDLCQEMQKRAAEVLKPTDPLPPKFPGFRALFTVEAGPAYLVYGVHLLDSGEVEHMITVYDEEDDPEHESPVFLFAGEQIDEFIEQTGVHHGAQT